MCNTLFWLELRFLSAFECITSSLERHWIMKQETELEVLDLWGVNAKIMWFTGKSLEAIRPILNL